MENRNGTGKKSYKHTLYASYLGYITQAIINNFGPLLFLTFQKKYELSLEQLAFLVTMNFGVQLTVDCAAAKFVDRIGYRVPIVGAHIFAGMGLIGLGTLPDLFAEPYIGLLAAVFIYAVGGGLIEVLVSPIVEACPTEEKSSAMSLLHSFYCWGHVLVVILSTVFFQAVGIDKWKYLAVLWAVVPLVNAWYFCFVPIRRLVEDGKGMSIRQLFTMKIFWVFILLMICSGASEQAMSQWASAFAESGLSVPKAVGDLFGPCLFAVMMGISRVFYAKFSGKIHLRRFILLSGIFCIMSFLLAAVVPVPVLALLGCGLCGLSVGILWPGNFSLASETYPQGGTALFALLALAGDVGCAVGPTLVGTVADRSGGDIKTGLLYAIVFPLLLVAGIGLLKIQKQQKL